MLTKLSWTTSRNFFISIREDEISAYSALLWPAIMGTPSYQLFFEHYFLINKIFWTFWSFEEVGHTTTKLVSKIKISWIILSEKGSPDALWVISWKGVGCMKKFSTSLCLLCNMGRSYSILQNSFVYFCLSVPEIYQLPKSSPWKDAPQLSI